MVTVTGPIFSFLNIWNVLRGKFKQMAHFCYAWWLISGVFVITMFVFSGHGLVQKILTFLPRQTYSIAKQTLTVLTQKYSVSRIALTVKRSNRLLFVFFVIIVLVLMIDCSHTLRAHRSPCLKYQQVTQSCSSTWTKEDDCSYVRWTDKWNVSYHIFLCIQSNNNIACITCIVSKSQYLYRVVETKEFYVWFNKQSDISFTHSFFYIQHFLIPLAYFSVSLISVSFRYRLMLG